MKASKISLCAALIAGVLVAYSPVSRAEDTAAPKDPPKREGRPGGPEAMKERLNKLAEELKLDDAQKTKVEAAMKEQGEKMRTFRQDTTLTDEQKREKGKALREDFNKKMKEILTAEQYAKFEKMPGPGGRPGGPGGPGGEGKKKKKAE